MSFAFDCLMASARLAWITIHDDTINLEKDNWKLLAKLLAVRNHYWLWLNKHCIGFPYAVQSCEANAPSWIEHLPKVNDSSSSHWDGNDLSLRTSVNWLFKRHCVLEKTLSCKNAFSWPQAFELFINQRTIERLPPWHATKLWIEQQEMKPKVNEPYVFFSWAHLKIILSRVRTRHICQRHVIQHTRVVRKSPNQYCIKGSVTRPQVVR